MRRYGVSRLEGVDCISHPPWKEATDDERLDVNNGILLSPAYDALFDRHLITFDNNGKIVLSESLEKREYKKIGVTGAERIRKLNSDNIAAINGRLRYIASRLSLQCSIESSKRTCSTMKKKNAAGLFMISMRDAYFPYNS